jgi:hypothetical protein
MQLTLAPKSIGYPMLRLESAAKRWEMGVYPTIYGTRVSCGIVGSSYYVKGGYCCGTSGSLLMEVTVAIAAILSTFPESATHRDVEDFLPSWNLRPIDRDDGLAKLRAAVLMRSPIETVFDPNKEILKQLTWIFENIEVARQEAHLFQINALSLEKP